MSVIRPLLCLLPLLVLSSSAHAEQMLIVLVGAAGDEEYEERFLEWMERWRHVADQAGVGFQAIGLGSESTAPDRQRLLEVLQQQRSDGDDPLWLVLIGHGTFDGRTAKFNLRGPDLSAAELALWLKEFSRPLVVVNCASASAPFVNQLSAENRVIVAATKSGYEYNYARFGRYLSEAIADTQADLDKDEQTSLLEAFLLAAARVAEFYEAEGRLATENAIVDDNGDGLGTPASWFRGVRTTRSPRDNKAAPDGLRANQFFLLRSEVEQRLSPDERQHRDELERELEELRARKASLPSERYYDQLQEILLELAAIYVEQPEREEAAP